MKSKTISVLILSITLIFSTTLILASFGFSKPKPNPHTNPEWITFSGHLIGEQEVVGCCPNAGPCPKYTMTLAEPFEELAGTYEGDIFMNFFGAGKNRQVYIVKFWWTIDSIDYYFKIIGGIIERDRKTKKLTVNFVNVDCDIESGDNIPYGTVKVTFTLTREPL